MTLLVLISYIIFWKNICIQDRSSIGKKSKGHACFITQCLVLTKRSMVNMGRDIGYYWLRLGIYAIVALSLATTFSHLGKSYGSIQVINTIRKTKIRDKNFCLLIKDNIWNRNLPVFEICIVNLFKQKKKQMSQIWYGL